MIRSLLIVLAMTIIAHASLTTDQLQILALKANHENAIRLCLQQRMHLIKIQDEQTNEIVQQFVKARGLENYWLDGNDRVNESNWVYEDGSKITYSKWDSNQPDNWNNEDCLHGISTKNGLWNDCGCYMDLVVICYFKKDEIGSISEDQLVYLPYKVNKEIAVQLCKQQGMNLIRIQDEETDRIVYNFSVKRRLGRYWIDANDLAHEGQWVYEDGNKIKYNKWHLNEPNNYQNEDCAHGFFSEQRFWNDHKCDNNYTVICFRDKSFLAIESIAEDQLLALPYEVNQQVAVQLCRQHDMNLIRIQDEQTNQMVCKFALKNLLGHFWIDAKYKVDTKQWVYENGGRITYSKWYPGKPGNSQNENCAHGFLNQKRFWKDIRCDVNNAVICYRKRPHLLVDSQTKIDIDTIKSKSNQKFQK